MSSGLSIFRFCKFSTQYFICRNSSDWRRRLIGKRSSFSETIVFGMQFCTHDSENLHTGNDVPALTQNLQVPVVEPVWLQRFWANICKINLNGDHEFCTADCSKHFGQEVLHP